MFRFSEVEHRVLVSEVLLAGRAKNIFLLFFNHRYALYDLY